MASSVYLIACLAVYAILCINESVFGALSNTHEGIGSPLEIADDDSKYTKFTGTAEDLRTEKPSDIKEGTKGQEEVVYTVPSSTETPSSDTSSSVYDETVEQGVQEEGQQSPDALDAEDGEPDVVEGGLDLGRTLAAKRGRGYSKKRIYKKVTSKLI